METKSEDQLEAYHTGIAYSTTTHGYRFWKPIERGSLTDAIDMSEMPFWFFQKIFLTEMATKTFDIFNVQLQRNN